MRHRTWIALVLVVVAVATVSGAAYALSELYWDRYDVDIEVRPDGTLRVTETQTIVFVNGSFHVGFASIPLDRLDTLTDIQVSENGRPYQRVTSERESGFQAHVEGNEYIVEWYFPYTSNAQRTFTLAYTVQGAIRRYPDADPPHDVVQWIAIAPDHEFPIDQSRVTVRLPRGVKLLPDASSPTGYNADAVGADAKTRVDVERGIVTVDAGRVVRPGESVEVGVKFEHGKIAGVASRWQSDFDRAERDGPIVAFASLLTTLGILALGPAFLFVRWYTKGRDPEVGLAADYLAEPPSDTPAGLVGVLIDECADMKDIIATLIDLARRGALTMEETQAPGFAGIGFARDYLFHPNPNFDRSSLRPYERTLLARVAGDQGGKLSALKNSFYTLIPTLEKQMYEAAVKDGFFPASPAGVRARYYGLGALLLAFAVVGGFFFVMFTAQASAAACFPAVALGLVAVLTLGVARAMPARTRRGAEENAKWRAFLKFMQDLPRFEKLEDATSLFDKYLPYAIAFGLERRWVTMFAVTNTPAPMWYRPWLGHGGSVMRAGGSPGPSGGPSLGEGLAGGLNSINLGLTGLFNQAGQVFRSVPSSSGSGRGFSGGYRGGGFRAGGGGGGGARGFR